MANKTKSGINSSSTINISEKDLINSLNDFLDKDEKSEKRSIWNIRTVMGLVFVMIAFSFFGNLISTEILGFSGLPFLNTIITITPYLAGAMLAVSCFGMLKSSKKNVKQRVSELRQYNKTRDNLDKFLYEDDDETHTKSRKRQKASMSSALKDSNTLYRSRTDKQLFGVCGGIARRTGMSSTVVRLIFLAAMFLGYGSPILLYIAMAIVMPKEPVEFMDDFN